MRRLMMLNTKIKFVLFILSVLIILSGTIKVVSAGLQVSEKGEVYESTGKGLINWTARKIEAKGYSNPDQDTYGQIKAAQLTARAELLTILKGIRITGDYGVIRGIQKKEIIEGHVEGYLAHCYVSEPEKNQKLGVYEARAWVYLDERLNSILMPEKVVFKSEAKQYDPPETQPATPEKYTGLIIDARGLKLYPAMAPRILVEGDLSEIFGGLVVDKDISMREGLAGYAGTIKKARELTPRIGENPLVIRAKQAINRSDVIISTVSAKLLAGAIVDNNFLKKCRVIMVLP